MSLPDPQVPSDADLGDHILVNTEFLHAEWARTSPAVFALNMLAMAAAWHNIKILAKLTGFSGNFRGFLRLLHAGALGISQTKNNAPIGPERVQKTRDKRRVWVPVDKVRRLCQAMIAAESTPEEGRLEMEFWETIAAGVPFRPGRRAPWT